LKGQVNVRVDGKCRWTGCPRYAAYGDKGRKVRVFCAKHRLAGHVLVKNSRYEAFMCLHYKGRYGYVCMFACSRLHLRCGIAGVCVCMYACSVLCMWVSICVSCEGFYPVTWVHYVCVYFDASLCMHACMYVCMHVCIMHTCILMHHYVSVYVYISVFWRIFCDAFFASVRVIM
jgi:hypothetical protein